MPQNRCWLATRSGERDQSDLDRFVRRRSVHRETIASTKPPTTTAINRSSIITLRKPLILVYRANSPVAAARRQVRFVDFEHLRYSACFQNSLP
jgi:hypothetical protein